MKKNLRFQLIITCLALSSINGIISGKQATIVFNSDCNITVSIYKPIDGACNFVTISDRIDLKPNLSISYKLDVSDFCFVKILYSNGLPYNLIIFENDDLYVTLKDNMIILKGSNSNSNKFLNDFRRYAFVDSIFDLHLKPNLDISAIKEDLYNTFWKGVNEDLIKLKSDGNISSDFIEIFSKDMGYAVAGMVVKDYYTILSGTKGIISTEDSIKILSQIDSIYQKYPPWANDVMKYRYSTLNHYLNRYYDEKYNHLSLQAKSKLIHDYGQDTFGPYISFLSAQNNIQLPVFGRAFLVQFDYIVNEFNKSEMLKYMEEHFPDSQYLELIKERLKDIEGKDEQAALPNDSIIILDENVNTLNELISLKSLKDNRLFIDLWATWCMPCRVEFQHEKELYPIAKKYNVKLVFLSIDKIVLKNKWESDVLNQDLTGYHLLVNEQLLKDIKKVIYKNQTVSIPRYVYINEKGEIVNDDAPRPSSITEIEKLFSGK